MSFPVILSFYTKNTLYEEEVCKLITSCEKFGLQTVIRGIESFGSWELNCAYKPFYICEVIEQLDQPVLWVDADGCFLKKPLWEKAFDADVSARFHDELNWDHPSKVISSTVFVNATHQGKALLRLWMDETEKQLLDPGRNIEFWDQIALRNVLQTWEGLFEPMPLIYTKIFDHPMDCLLVADPVIEHYQASRRFKKRGG